MDYFSFVGTPVPIYIFSLLCSHPLCSMFPLVSAPDYSFIVTPDPTWTSTLDLVTLCFLVMWPPSICFSSNTVSSLVVYLMCALCSFSFYTLCLAYHSLVSFMFSCFSILYLARPTCSLLFWTLCTLIFSLIFTHILTCVCLLVYKYYSCVL